MTKRRHIIIAVLVLLAASCNGRKTPETGKEVTVKTTNVEIFTVSPSTFEEYIALPVVVMPYRQVNLGLTNGGRVTEIRADKGDSVKKGQVLLKTDDVILQANLHNAGATLGYQKNEYARSEKLLGEGSITQAAFDGAKLQLAQAESAFRIAKKQLDEAVLAAPFDGTVTMRNVEVGDLLGPGSPAFRIIDVSRVKIQAGIPERYISDFDTGNNVTVKFDAVPGRRFEGTINFISPEANTSVRTFLAEIVVRNSDRILKPGIMGDARLLRKIHENAIMVPINAVIETQEGRSLYVAGSGDKAEKRNVVIGGANDTMFMITEGVRAGDRVVTKGQHNLVDGESLNIAGAYSDDNGEVAAQ
ncbi:MAG: efflux RND transporter periplasmic adaptor subunit [Candidatus Latescibacteria bacterium]|nr:efflux RND transporter periplasmic adaptor subunit [Candidatus Latescibacterota bacterium]